MVRDILGMLPGGEKYWTWYEGKEVCFFEELQIEALWGIHQVTEHQFLVSQIIELALVVQGTKPLFTYNYFTRAPFASA